MVDSGDDSRDGNSDESQMIRKIRSTNSSIQLQERRISSDNSLDEGNALNLLGDLSSKPNAQLAAILPSANSSASPSQLRYPSHSSTAITPTLVSRFPGVSSHSDPASVPQDVKKLSHAVEADDNAQQESAQLESFPNVNGHSENASSAENTQFSDLNLSPRSVQPLVELSDLTPLLGNSPQSPNREEPPQDVEASADNAELINDAQDALADPVLVTLANGSPTTQNSESPQQMAVEGPQLRAEPTIGECPSPMSTNSEPPQDVDQPRPETQDPPSPSGPCRGQIENVDAPGDPESSPRQESRTDDIEEAQVRSPFPETHEDGIDVNKCNPDPMDLGRSDDESDCANNDEVAPSPVPIPTPLASTTTGQALNLLRAMLVSNDDMDFSDFSCIEPLGPDFDPSNVNFLTHSEINKEMSADQSSSSSDFKGKDSIFNFPAASQSKRNIFDDDFPKCTNFLPTLMKVEPEYKSVAKACFDDFLECILEDSGVYTITHTDKISSESSDVDSIGGDSIDDSDSADRCCGSCQVVVERMPPSLFRDDHLSLSNKRYIAWRRDFAKERNEELFQHLRVWRKGRLLLWRECELAGMDRETYDRQVEYVKQHKIEVSSAASDTSDSEDASVDSGILPTCQISSDSSDSEISLDFEVHSVRPPPPVVSNILEKPGPKSKKLKYRNRQLSRISLEPSSSKEEYVVENNLVNRGRNSNDGKPASALKITIRKTSITKSDDENEGPVEREISSDEDIPVPLPVVKKVRRVAMKRTTRRVRSPQLTPEPVPSVPSSSTDDEFALSPHKTSPPDSMRKKKSYFVDEGEDDGSLLGRRADEVENHNLLERFEIPFEQPTLFRSPRMASKLAQLKNKEAFKSTIKHSKVPRVDPILKDVKMVVDELVLKTVEAILTQPRSRSIAPKKPPSEDLIPESIVNRVLTPPTTLEASGSAKPEQKQVPVEPVEKKPVPTGEPESNETTITEISSSVSASSKEKKRSGPLRAGKEPENAISSAKEFTVTSTHFSSAVADPKGSSQSSVASEPTDPESIEPGDVVDSSQPCNATTCQGKAQAKESPIKNQASIEKRATRARQPNIEVNLDLIETLDRRRKKRRSTNKETQKISESPNSFLETADDSQKSDPGMANDASNVSADDSVTTTSKPQTRKKRRRISRFGRKRVQKPASEKIVKESNSECEDGDNVSKSLVQVAEISEGKGSENIADPCPAPSTPEPQFTRRVLRSHPRASSLKSVSALSEDPSDLPSKEVDSEEKATPSEDISVDQSTSPSSSSAAEPNIADKQSCDLELQKDSSECRPEPSKTSAEEIQDQAPISSEQPTAELPEISENLNLETEGDDGESVLDDWHSVGSPVGEVEDILETASKSDKNAQDESSMLFDALLASSFNKNAEKGETTNNEAENLSNVSSKEELENAGLEKRQQPDEENAETSVSVVESKDDKSPAADELLAPLDFTGIDGSENFPSLTIDQMKELAKGMEETGGADMDAEEKVDDQPEAEQSQPENNQQSTLNNEEQIDFSSLSNILNMADSAEDLIIDQPFSDDEPEQNELNDCIIDIIQNHIVVMDSPTKDKNVVNSEGVKDSAKPQSKDDSIDERTGLPTTLIRRLRDPRIRSKVMSQLEGGEKIAVPQLPVQPAPAEPPPPTDCAKTQIEPKELPSRTVENVSRDPRAIRGTTMVTRSCTEAAQKATTFPVSDKAIIGNQESSNAPAQTLADAPAEDSGQPADEEDEEEEALKRRPKKAKKTIDTELVYKSPLEDLEKEPLQSYGRNLPRRYPVNDSRPRGYAENRPSRWDMRNAVVKTGPQESSRHPDMAQMPTMRPQPHIPPPVLQVHNQHSWMYDQNADCLPSYVESPQWQGNWMNDQPFNPVDRRKARIAAEIAALQREPKTVDLAKSAIRKPVLAYIKNAFKEILPKPPLEFNPEDREVVISMMDPFGQEIDMVQLPRPTANLTKAYLAPVSNYKLIEDMVTNPSIAFSRYMDEEKVDELVLDFFDEGDAAKIVRMQSHVPTKRAGFLETEPTTKEEEEKSKSGDDPLDGIEETDVKSSDPVESKDPVEPKSADEPGDQKAAKKPKIPSPPGKMEFLDIILHHLPILKEQYSFKTSPLKAPDNSAISGAELRLPAPPESPASPSPPLDVKTDAPKNSPPRIMKALLNLSKSERLRRVSKRSRSKSPPLRRRSKSPFEYRRRHRSPPSPPRAPIISRRKRSRTPVDYRRKALDHRSRSPKSHRRHRASKDTTSSECSTPRYSISSRTPSPAPARRRCRRALTPSSSASSKRSSSPAPLPKAYRRSWTRSPSSYRSRSISESPPRK
ncbi:unnamed protein product, partial [Nesidiocoris tenuis]